MADRLQYHERARVIFNSEVHAYGKLILLALSDRMWKRDEAFPSYNTLARDTSISRRSVVKHVQRLIGEGILDRRHDQSNRRSNTYEICWNKLAIVQDVHHQNSERAALTPNEGSEGAASAIVKELHLIVQDVHRNSERAAPEREKEKEKIDGKRRRGEERAELSVKKNQGKQERQIDSFLDEEDRQELRIKQRFEAALTGLQKSLNLPKSSESLSTLVREFRQHLKGILHSLYRSNGLANPTLETLIADMTHVFKTKMGSAVSLGAVFFQTDQQKRLEDGITALINTRLDRMESIVNTILLELKEEHPPTQSLLDAAHQFPLDVVRQRFSRLADRELTVDDARLCHQRLIEAADNEVRNYADLKRHIAKQNAWLDSVESEAMETDELEPSVVSPSSSQIADKEDESLTSLNSLLMSLDG